MNKSLVLLGRPEKTILDKWLHFLAGPSLSPLWIPLGEKENFSIFLTDSRIDDFEMKKITTIWSAKEDIQQHPCLLLWIVLHYSFLKRRISWNSFLSNMKYKFKFRWILGLKKKITVHKKINTNLFQFEHNFLWNLSSVSSVGWEINCWFIFCVRVILLWYSWILLLKNIESKKYTHFLLAYFLFKYYSFSPDVFLVSRDFSFWQLKKKVSWKR